MTAEQKASTTMIWLKQLTTGTFSTINQKVDKIEFLRRNKKQLLMLGLAWVLLFLTWFLLGIPFGPK